MRIIKAGLMNHCVEVVLMNEIIENTMQTPIEIALGVDENGKTTAKKLYTFLELNPAHYARWCKTNIIENEFATENEDYEPFTLNGECGGQATQDFKLTSKFARKLSMTQKNHRGEEARNYFTGLEDRAKEITINRQQLSPQMQMLMGMVETQARQELEQKRLAKEVEEVKQTQNAIVETFQKTDDAEDFQQWANDKIARIAESPKFDRGFGRSKNYSLARAESYERLKQKRNCRLDDRVQKAIGRALGERPDIKKSELQKINKIYIIANDKDLRPAYELVIKEMMIYYCVS